MTTQIYEKYWRLTLEYTDFNDSKFLTTLRLIVEKIDKLNLSNAYLYNANDYQQLQEDILVLVPKTSTKKNQLASTRKAINQCVKLGFVENYLAGYHPLTKQYLEAKTDYQRRTLFSKIVYDNSKFNAATTIRSDWNQMKFLINTLVENECLTKAQILSLMLVDISNNKKGYLNKDELKEYLVLALKIGFIERKYNQVRYLNNILNKLDGIVFVNDELYFTEDLKRNIWSGVKR